VHSAIYMGILMMGEVGYFQGSIWQALMAYQKACQTSDDEAALWGDECFVKTMEAVQKASHSIAILRRHLPPQFHSLVRFSQQQRLWCLTVEKPVVAHQFEALLDDLLIRITKDIGSAVPIKIVVVPDNWSLSGLPIVVSDKAVIDLPTSSEARQIIDIFLQSSR